jgi:hypothetical protein
MLLSAVHNPIQGRGSGKEEAKEGPGSSSSSEEEHQGSIER